jgi:hypothetical protein
VPEMPGDGRSLPPTVLDCWRYRSYGRRRLDISGPGGALTPRGPAPRTGLDAPPIVRQPRMLRVAGRGVRLIAICSSRRPK